MNKYKKLTSIFSLTACLAILAMAGCGNNVSGDVHTETAAESDHEGSNNGPGEHGQATAAGDTINVLDWCAEHAVPESQCTKCNPDLIASFKEASDWCAGHDLPESHCRLCNPDIVFPQEEVIAGARPASSGEEIEVSLYFRPNAAICATDGATIQLASANTAERAGLTIQPAHAGYYENSIEAPAEIKFDENYTAVVTSTVPALIGQWRVSPGDVVLKGDILATVQSPEIASLRSALVSANAAFGVQQKEMERHRELMARSLISNADFERQEALTEQAEAALVAARGMLLAAGFNESDIEETIKHGSLSNQFALRSPSGGVVVERIAQLGELLEAGRAFAVVADPRAMWIEARLTEAQLRHAAIGQELTFTSDGGGLHRVGGKIIWVSRFLDPHTRTGVVRAQVVDSDHRLQAGEFGRVKIIKNDDIAVTLVPKDAVQWEGCCNVVFVREQGNRYRPRKVELLESDGPYYQVTGNIRPGEEVVVGGAFLLKTELKKSSLGAGCCGIEPIG